MAYIFRPLTPDEAIDNWAQLEPIFDRVTEVVPHKFRTLDVLRLIAKNDFICWAIVRKDDEGLQLVAAFTTSISEFPQGRIMCVEFVAGDEMTGWVEEMSKVVEDHARANGCSHVEAAGRKGWTKLLKPQGWADKYTVYEKEVSDG